MKYLWYGFLGLFSLGFLGLVACMAIIVYTINFYGSDLPDYEQLKDYQPPIVTRIYAGDGRLMAEFAQEKRVFMPIEKIPDIVKQAFIAAEDKNFYTHQGIDPSAIVRAAIVYAQYLLGRDVNVIGGSTITQQVIKNFLLTNERKFERKIREAILANRIERAMSKDQILELYLNEIFLGYRAYGVAAAALQYFNKSLEELSIAEVAYLAGLPKAPNNYHPTRHYDAAIKQRNEVLRRMLKNGFITEAQEELAKIASLETIKRNKDRIVKAPYFAEEVRRELGARYGQDSLYQGGLAVRTTVDPKLQNIAIQSLRDGLMAYDRRHGYRGPLKTISNVAEWKEKLKEFKKPQGVLDEWDVAIVLDAGAERAEIGLSGGQKGYIPLSGVLWARKSLNEGYARGPEIKEVSAVLSKGDMIAVSSQEENLNSFELRQIPQVQGSIMAMDPHTGRILAMQGGWKYGISEFNRATQAQRQPGSAFKPFVYLAALENDFTPATLVLDAPFVIEDRPGNFWSPTNYSNEYYGPTPIRVGVEKSRNLMTVRLADYLGMDVVSDFAKRFGIDDDMPPLLANSLGAGESTLLKMTTSYAEIVNGGKKVTPAFIDRIQDRRGDTVFRHDERSCRNCGSLIRWEGQEAPDPPDTREQLVDERHAYQMVSIMEGVVQRGTGVRLKELGRPLAGKTGTTNESKDAWFIGFSPDLVVGVFIGFDDPRSLGKRETGSSVALPVFKDFMKQALENEPLVPFRIPNGIRNVQINAATGARAQPGDTKTIWEAFVTGTEPTENMYILDGTGINLVTDSPAYYGYDEGIEGNDAYSADALNNGYFGNGGYNQNVPGNGEPTPPAGPYQKQETSDGTGGLY